MDGLFEPLSELEAEAYAVAERHWENLERVEVLPYGGEHWACAVFLREGPPEVVVADVGRITAGDWKSYIEARVMELQLAAARSRAS